DLRVGPDLSNLNSAPLLQISAMSVAIITSDGFAADLDVDLGMNVPGVQLTAHSRVLINMTGKDQEVDLPDRILNFLNSPPASTIPLAASLLNRLEDHSDGSKFYNISQYQPDITDATKLANLLNGGHPTPIVPLTQDYVCAVIGGKLDLLHFASCDVTAGIAISPNDFLFRANLNFSIGISGIDLKFTGDGLIDISKAGLHLTTDVSLNADITPLLHLKASGTLLIDTFTDIFHLSLNGDLTIAKILTVSGGFSIDVGAGGPNTWRVGFDLSGGLGSHITVSAGGWIQSDGQFSITVGGNLSYGITDFGISGY